ncbi:hypothetical protein CROQUDRAFT_658403 [Cronartium quercuum f. sp. fusiforme G11]|uniref:E3 ubiquitin-protein ligase n=1 Tax=Cronartium quercuum f. sp. fusiforme G11 TaxID=708437 RepID=A0A9P6NK41_9BASI|nr:hypothetical protein CROQUDRAFT_658403 [Cronartium quercuum f. sp. fusiforme G11]
MDPSPRFQETHTLLDGKPFIIRHKPLNPIRNSVSLHTFLSKIDYLATALESPACPPTKQNLSFCPETAVQMLKTLYSFALEPKWATHFFPRHAFTIVDELRLPNGERVPIATLPKVNTSFSLLKTQGEEAIEYGTNRRGKPCGHVFQKGEGVYHCSDCGIDPTCALCSKCFIASDHTGHDVIYSVHSTGCGCCDCGDVEAWKTDVKCRYHRPLTAEETEEAKRKAEDKRAESAHQPHLNPLSKECKDVLDQIVNIALDFLLITLERAPEDMAPPNTVENIYSELSRLEENAYLDMARHPYPNSDDAMEIDPQYSHHHNPYHLENLAVSDPSGQPTPTNRFTALWGGKGKGKSVDTSGSSAVPAAPPPTPASFGLVGHVGRFEGPRGSGESSGGELWSKCPPLANRVSDPRPKGAGPWGVVLWNDEKHSYSQVIDQVSRATGCTRAEALEIANRVDTKGREIVEVSSDANELLQTCKIISSIDLMVTVRTAHDLFCEQIAELVINFLVDIASCRLYDVPPEDDTWIKELIVRKLCAKPDVGYEGGDKTRFARFLLNDIKLWKDARDRLKSLYISLLALGQPTKLQLGLLFASIFPQLIEYNLLVDREPEHNILLFSLQIVTVPSVILVLVTEHGFLKMILDLLYSFFTQQFGPTTTTDGEYRHIIYPPDYEKKEIDPEGMSFRHKRYYHLFHELNLILTSSGVQQAICKDTRYISDLITFLDLFTNMNPYKRAVNVHVEFESDAWVTAFNLTIQLAKLCKFFGECYAKATDREFVDAVQVLTGYMLKRDHKFHEVPFGSSYPNSNLPGSAGAVGYRCVDFKIDHEPVSFHHPLNWLLSEMMRNIYRVDLDSLDSIPVHSMADLYAERAPLALDRVDMGALMVCEDVIRVAALLAQVRAGLWVRNGFGVRAQQLHYREYSLRETTFDQDIYQIQILLASKDPSHILVAIVDRFGLRQWCNGELLTDRVYEPSQMILMLEELLHFIIIILSEPAGITGLGQDENLKREIIHVLAHGPMAYSDILKRIPDRYMQDSGFDKILKQVTDFKQPSGTNDVGTYSLKPEAVLEIDPYYCRFGRNQREEAERIVLEQLKKSTGQPEPVIVPRPLKIGPGPFACFNHTYHSEVLLQMIFYALARVNPTMKGYSEYLADQAIHLVMMGLVSQPEAFANMAIEQKLPLKGASPHSMTLMMMLEAVDGEPAMKGVKKKVNWCLDEITRIAGLPSRSSTKAGGMTTEEKAAAVEEQKKEAAKARQNAIMNQFAAAQQAFLMSNELGDEDEEDEEVEDERIETEVEKEKVYGNCILCQEDLTSARAFGALGLIQSSRIIRTTPLNLSFEEAQPWLEEVLLTPSSLDRDTRKGFPTGVASRQPVNKFETRLGPDGNVEAVEWHPQGFPTRHSTKLGLFTSACGHMLHMSCFQAYYATIELRHTTQVTRNHPENPERCEYLCPLCKSIGNIFLPAVDPVVSKVKEDDEVKLGLVDWLSSVEGIEDEMDAEMNTSDYNSVLNLTEQDELVPWFLHSTMPQDPRKQALVRAEDKEMLERFLTVSGALGREFGETGQRPSFARDLVAYTLQCNEIANRGQGGQGGVMECLSETQEQLIRSLLAILGMLLVLETGTMNAKKYATGLLMRQLTPPISLPEVVTAGDYGTLPIIFTDPFSLVIHCAAVCPEAFGLVVPLCYHLELLRVLLGLTYLSRKYPGSWWKLAEEAEEEGEGIEDRERRGREGRSLKELLVKVVETCKMRQAEVLRIEEVTLDKLVRRYTLPFLRRAAMLKSVVMNTKAGAGTGSGAEHDRLRAELGVPSVVDLLYDVGKVGEEPGRCRSGVMCAVVFGWLSHLHHYVVQVSGTDEREQDDLLVNEELTRAVELEHPVIYELVGLPLKFEKLLGEAARKKCGRCGTIPNDPGICLLCGTTVCVQAFCCTNRNLSEEPENGECNVHMWNCGGAVGLFLLIKKCSVLYLSTQNGTFTMAPYLDEHGEHDMGMKRGRPQFLHQVRWDEIRKIWLTHSIPTHVARRQENNSDNGGWPTF